MKPDKAGWWWAPPGGPIEVFLLEGGLFFETYYGNTSIDELNTDWEDWEWIPPPKELRSLKAQKLSWETRQSSPTPSEIRAGHKFWMSPLTAGQWAVWLFRVSEQGEIYIYYPNGFTWDVLTPAALSAYPWRCCTEDGQVMPLPVWKGPHGECSSSPQEGVEGWTVLPVSE